MKSLPLVLLLATFIILMNFQCNDCESELHDSYSYEATIEPLQSIYQLNDTISLRSIFPARFDLTNSGQVYDNTNDWMNFEIQIIKLTEDNGEAIKALDYFQIEANSGNVEMNTYLENKSAFQLSTNCAEFTCGFDIDLIANTEGIFGVQLLSGDFGNQDCEYLSLFNNEFAIDDNNFSIAEKINTSEFRNVGGSYIKNGEELKSFYFFQVEN